MKEKTTDIGVIIGRFQAHELHSEHIKLIESVLSKHEKVVVFLGTSSAIGTKRNPLDFITRKVMLEEKFGTEISMIAPLADQKSNEVWSKSVDEKVRDIFPSGSVTLYGSKDSFIPYYFGSFKTSELEPEVYVSATDIRKEISKKILSSSDFRAGIIYSAYNQYPIMHSTVDVLIKDKDGRILLGKKSNENKWRFVGGFVDPTDESDEAAAKREGLEETGLELGNFKFICSKKIDDWRYRNVPDRKIMTHFYECEVIFGHPEPNDDIAELKWINSDDMNTNNLVEEHKILFEMYLDYTNNKD